MLCGVNFAHLLIQGPLLQRSPVTLISDFGHDGGKGGKQRISGRNRDGVMKQVVAVLEQLQASCDPRLIDRLLQHRRAEMSLQDFARGGGHRHRHVVFARSASGTFRRCHAAEKSRRISAEGFCSVGRNHGACVGDEAHTREQAGAHGAGKLKTDS